MKSFLGFIKKEFYHILRDPRTLMVILGIPISQMLLFGFVIRTEIQDVKVAVFDQSNDYMTTRIIDKLESSGYFSIEKYLESTDDVEAMFKKGNIKEVLVFEPGFAEKTMRDGAAKVQLLADASDPNIARMVTTYTQNIIRSFEHEEFQQQTVPMQINVQNRMFYNEEAKSVYMFVPGLMAMIMMLVSAIMSSVSITREKELGTMEVLLVSPLRPLQIILGKVTPYLLVAFIDTILIVLMGNLVFEMPINGSLTLLLSICFLFIFLSLSLGILISTIAPTQLIAMFISMIGLMLPTMLLSGFIFPIENMPKVLQWFSAIMPARWFNDVVKDIMLKGSGFFNIIKEVAILTGMSILFVVVSVKKFKIRLA
ncbi:MAG: ABC transporter permease [Prolixibacteraceae bacterium]|jgi:ABC-2 type transport system permease protein|nr:ABC transporter permease [Prolixibacteraceae bacterium]